MLIESIFVFTVWYSHKVHANISVPIHIELLTEPHTIVPVIAQQEFMYEKGMKINSAHEYVWEAKDAHSTLRKN